MVRRLASGLALPAVAVTVEPGARAAGFACAPTMMEWVFLELFTNARKFHPRHEPMLEVGVRLDGTGAVVLTVADDGVVLSPVQLACAGQPYFQAEKRFTGESPGMGLGLASVFAQTWQAGGSGTLRNRTSGPGVCVELTWPQLDGRTSP
jgi:signal transduction histidine kinase